jgi:hypothetical protein
MICRYAEALPEPLPSLLRSLMENMILGIVAVEAYQEAARCLGEDIAMEVLRLSPWLELYDNQPISRRG